jgi:hypothetical protein
LGLSFGGFAAGGFAAGGFGLSKEGFGFSTIEGLSTLILGWFMTASAAALSIAAVARPLDAVLGALDIRIGGARGRLGEVWEGGRACSTCLAFAGV